MHAAMPSGEMQRRAGRRLAAVVGAGVISVALLAGCTGAPGSGGGAPTPPLVTAPQSTRVDLGTPTFSHPTAITNPLFPVSALQHVVMLGTEAGDTLRFEVTTLPQTKLVEWNGQQVETRVSSFVGYRNGRVAEIALDYFAQADDGAVWYFGEDVTNYEDGVVLDHDGTWLAGKDGPPGMIMPADPKVGDVYRPENIPGLVFEEVTVKSDGTTVQGPRGAVPGAIRIQELLMDGLLEYKTFAPGYGEFQFSVPTEKESAALALAVPTDSVAGAVPPALAKLSSGARDVFGAVPTGDWQRMEATVDEMSAAWETHEEAGAPELLGTQMDEALDVLESAVESLDTSAVSQATIDVSHASLDLQLQYRAPADVDRDRFDVWSRQLLLDQVAGDAGAVAGDKVILDAIQQRMV